MTHRNYDCDHNLKPFFLIKEKTLNFALKESHCLVVRMKKNPYIATIYYYYMFK